MKWTRRKTVWSAAGAIVLVLLALAFRPSPVIVDSAVVERGPMQVAVRSKGETRVKDRFEITAPVTGRVDRIELREGTPVSKGDLVATIHPSPADPRQVKEIEARIHAAQAGVRETTAMTERARSTLALARKERQRLERLASEGIASREDLDRARSAESEALRDVQASQSRAQAASSELEAARAGLLALPNGSTDRPEAAMSVRSPVAGRVLKIPERSSRIVTAGEPLITLGNARQLELVIDVLSSDAVRISRGDPVVLEEWGGEKPLRGRVRLVEPSAFTKISALGIEEQRVNVIADLENPPPQLGDAYRVEASIVIWHSPDVLKVPVSALSRLGEDWSVFIINDGRARRRVVRIGHRNEREGEVLEGLEKGDAVVAHPGNDLADGVRVKAE